jgi:hypothetical protein
MNPEWIITGIILLGGMIAAAISLYIRQRKEAQTLGFADVQPDSDYSKNDKHLVF